jgi:hypothetical protein
MIDLAVLRNATCSTGEMGIMAMGGSSAVLHIRKECLERRILGICSTAELLWMSLNGRLSVLHVWFIPGYAAGIRFQPYSSGGQMVDMWLNMLQH